METGFRIVACQDRHPASIRRPGKSPRFGPQALWVPGQLPEVVDLLVGSIRGGQRGCIHCVIAVWRIPQQRNGPERSRACQTALDRQDRKSVVEGKRVSLRVDPGDRLYIKKKKKQT